jgi:hypothetical protein
MPGNRAEGESGDGEVEGGYEMWGRVFSDSQADSAVIVEFYTRTELCLDLDVSVVKIGKVVKNSL